MIKQVAINGFGRIGRSFFRHAYRQDGFRIAAINDVADTEMPAHLLKYDSVHGRFSGEVCAAGDRGRDAHPGHQGERARVAG